MKPSNVLVLVGLVATVALAIASCKSNTINAGNGATCTESSSCPNGSVCLNGECRAQCQVDVDCKDPTLVCLNGMCQSLPADSGAVDGTSGNDSAPDTANVPASFSVQPALWRVTRGSTAAVEVDVSRGSLTGAVDVTVMGLPSGITVTTDVVDGGVLDAGGSTFTIAAGASSAMITVIASATATEGLTQLALQATGVSNASAPLVVAGTSGSLDPSFNTAGVVNVVPPGGDGTAQARAVAIQSDGSIVVAGSRSRTPDQGWAVIRLKGDGTRDAAFDTALANASLGALVPASGELVDVVVAPDGHIFVLGSTGVGAQHLASVLALNPDGSRVQAFGANGLYTYNPSLTYPKGATPTAITPDGSGGLYVAWIYEGKTLSVVAHLDANGSPIGVNPLNIPADIPATIHALAVGPAGVYFAGETPPDGGAGYATGQYVGHRYTDGGTDPAFPGPFPNQGVCAALTATSCVVGDAIVDDAGGLTFTATNGGSGPAPILGRFALDGGFLIEGGARVMPQAVPNDNGYGRAALQPDDKLIVVGGGASSMNSIAYVGRFSLDARLDPSFNDGGYFKKQVAFQSSFGMSYEDVAVDAVGRIVVVGWVDPNGWTIVRIWP